jgi:plastocyanin
MPRIHALLFLTATAGFSACGGGDSGGSDITQPGNPPANTISIVRGAETKGSAAFNPNPLTVTLASGGSVTWRNDDRQADDGYGGGNGTPHNITADDLAFFFVSGSMAPGATFRHTFTVAGTYPYHCSVHPAMKGTVTVSE